MDFFVMYCVSVLPSKMANALATPAYQWHTLESGVIGWIHLPSVNAWQELAWMDWGFLLTLATLIILHPLFYVWYLSSRQKKTVASYQKQLLQQRQKILDHQLQILHTQEAIETAKQQEAQLWQEIHQEAERNLQTLGNFLNWQSRCSETQAKDGTCHQK